MNSHTLSVLLQDGPAALNRASSMLRRGGVNVSSLTLTASGAPGVLEMTVVVERDKAHAVARHLGSLVEVLAVRDVTPGSVGSRLAASVVRAGGAAPGDRSFAEREAARGSCLYRAQADGTPDGDSV
jgi:acetolactate synthase small subunit